MITLAAFVLGIVFSLGALFGYRLARAVDTRHAARVAAPSLPTAKEDGASVADFGRAFAAMMKPKGV